MRRSVTAFAVRTCRAFTRSVDVRRRCVSRSLLEGTERATALGCAGPGRSRPPLPLVPRVNRPLAPLSARLRWGGARQSVGLEGCPILASLYRACRGWLQASYNVLREIDAPSIPRVLASWPAGSVASSSAIEPPCRVPRKESRTVNRRRSSRSLLTPDGSPCGSDDEAGCFWMLRLRLRSRVASGEETSRPPGAQNECQQKPVTHFAFRRATGQVFDGTQGPLKRRACASRRKEGVRCAHCRAG
jgi:hypothetical protein